MQDPSGRETTDFRISVTNLCNLRCFYCHNEGQPLDDMELMSPAEIERIVAAGTAVGIERVKISGGEPTLRKDLPEIVSRTARHVREVSLVTNGHNLARLAGGLKEAGLHRINISIDSMDPVTFKVIRGADIVDRVEAGIREAHRVGLGPIKVNMVVLRGVNHDRVEEMVRWAAERDCILQLIEVHTDRAGEESHLYRNYFHSLEDVERDLAQRAYRRETRSMHRRPIYTFPLPSIGRMVTVEVVRPMKSRRFCANCTRIRLTADGKLKPCLFVDHGLVDILGPLRAGATDEELADRFRQLVRSRVPYWSDEGDAAFGAIRNSNLVHISRVPLSGVVAGAPPPQALSPGSGTP